MSESNKGIEKTPIFLNGKLNTLYLNSYLSKKTRL